MSSSVALEPVPLRTDEHGVIRIGATRVRLDTVVHAFETGASAEDLAEAAGILWIRPGSGSIPDQVSSGSAPRERLSGTIRFHRGTRVPPRAARTR